MELHAKVTVIVPVYNCRSSLARAFTSVFEQSMDASAIEIIAVDDGSTDGGGEELDRLAAGRPGFTVLRQQNSGGPGAPRNRGLERATGEYVFFLDADDYFAPEALERMCALADENRTDVVVGQCVGVNRRPPVFPRDVARTTLAESPFVYDTLSPLKLFRRSLLERNDIRFVEGISSHEDQLFTARAYFAADGISVLAGYDCYYWVDREDGTSSLQNGGAPAEQYFPVIADVMEHLAGRVEPGPLRDRLMQRHFRYEVFSRFGARYPGLSDEEKALTRQWSRKLLDSWYTPGVESAFGPRARLIAHCLRTELDDLLERTVPTWIDGVRPPTVVDGDRAYMALPGFRDPAANVPDDLYEITDKLGVEAEITGLGWAPAGLRIEGRAAVAGVPAGDVEATLVLRAGEERERRVPADRSPDAAGGGAFAAWLDLGDAQLEPGAWEAYAEVRVGELRRIRRLTVAEACARPPEPRLAARGRRVAPHVASARAFDVRVAEDKPGGLLLVDEAGLTGRGVLTVHARVPCVLPEGSRVDVAAELVRRGEDTGRAAAVECRRLPERVELVAEYPVAGCTAGRWDLWLRLDVDGVPLRMRVPCPEVVPGPVKPRGTGRVTPYRTERGGLSLKVAEATGMAARGRRLLRGSRRG